MPAAVLGARDTSVNSTDGYALARVEAEATSLRVGGGWNSPTHSHLSVLYPLLQPVEVA